MKNFIKLDNIKIKNVSSSEDILKNMKRQIID